MDAKRCWTCGAEGHLQNEGHCLADVSQEDTKNTKLLFQDRKRGGKQRVRVKMDIVKTVNVIMLLRSILHYSFLVMF